MLYMLHFTLYTFPFTFHALCFTLYTLHLYTLHFTPYTLHFMFLRSALCVKLLLCTVQDNFKRYTLYTLHFTFHPLQVTRFTLYSFYCMCLHFALCTLHFTAFLLSFCACWYTVAALLLT